MKNPRLLVALGASLALPLSQVPAHAQYNPTASLARSAETLTADGQLAPDFRVTLLDGTSMTLGSQRGKIVILNLFATWCPYCRQEFPYLQWLNKRHSGPNFTVLCVSRDEPVAEVANFWRANQLIFPVAVDPGAQIFSQYATRGVPRTYVIGPTGHILYQTSGFSAEAADYIDRLVTQIKTSSQGKKAFAWRRANQDSLLSLIKKPNPQFLNNKRRNKAVYLMDEKKIIRLG